jgi:hypothetical protein
MGGRVEELIQELQGVREEQRQGELRLVGSR